jgi:microcystin-dependent protein
MPYIVNFTDKDNKTPITVFDNTSSTDTSLTFPGRNVTGYGQTIAENFLHVLENFSSAIAPVNPTEGQLWYDSANGVLQLFDGTNWKAASNIQKSPTVPDVAQSKVGELWVDTTNQQLRIYTGSRWILVGPSESSIDGLRYGPAVERVADSDNIERAILIFYIADRPVIIISKDTFTPKITILGYEIIKSGINIATPRDATEEAEFEEIFRGGLLPKLFGTAYDADALNVVDATGDTKRIEAGKFLRSDIVNTTDFGFNIKNNNGITLGVDSTFEISNSSTAAKIYNKAPGSSLDLQINRSGVPNTILRIIDNRVGINKAVPEQALDVDGNILTSGSLIVSNSTESTNLNNGSIRTLGGASITKNLIVGQSVDISGITQVADIQPRATDTYDNGTTSKRWKTVRTKLLVADEIQGVLTGNISGTANQALALASSTTFQMIGDVTSPSIEFDGLSGDPTKIFNTTLTANIIVGKSEPFPNISRKADYVLTYRASGSGSSGLLKQTRDVFVGDLGIPIGTILPYAGANAPYGFLFCDGAEVERVKYSDLYNVIGTTYSKTIRLAYQVQIGLVYTIESVGLTDWTNFGATSNTVGETFTAVRNGIVSDNVGASTGAASTSSFAGIGTFRLPDMRGRFTLGRDNMDNGETVPNATGGYVDAGGGTAARVPDINAQILGGSAGQSSVTLGLTNLPDHEHSLQNAGVQYSAVRIDTSINPPATTGAGPTAVGQAQYLNTSGPVKKPDPSFTLGTPVGTMNPYLTINYIIRSGPPAF